jgi:hypothetical protein
MKNTHNIIKSKGEVDVASLVIGVFIFILAVILFTLYGLPAIQNTSDATEQEKNKVEVEVKIPSPGTSSGSEENFFKD